MAKGRLKRVWKEYFCQFVDTVWFGDILGIYSASYTVLVEQNLGCCDPGGKITCGSKLSFQDEPTNHCPPPVGRCEPLILSL